MVSETLSIKISKAEKNLLQQCARRSRSTSSALLRDALQSVLRSPQTAPASLFERHSHLFENLDRGPGDLSSNKKWLRGYGK